MKGQNSSPVIKAVSKAVIHRIGSGQVILDLSSAVKELVENSLDAGACCIEISLKEHGEEYFKVIDNGCGISPKNFQDLFSEACELYIMELTVRAWMHAEECKGQIIERLISTVEFIMPKFFISRWTWCPNGNMLKPMIPEWPVGPNGFPSMHHETMGDTNCASG